MFYISKLARRVVWGNALLPSNDFAAAGYLHPPSERLSRKQSDRAGLKVRNEFLQQALWFLARAAGMGKRYYPAYFTVAQ